MQMIRSFKYPAACVHVLRGSSERGVEQKHDNKLYNYEFVPYNIA